MSLAKFDPVHPSHATQYLNVLPKRLNPDQYAYNNCAEIARQGVRALRIAPMETTEHGIDLIWAAQARRTMSEVITETLQPPISVGNSQV